MNDNVLQSFKKLLDLSEGIISCAVNGYDIVLDLPSPLNLFNNNELIKAYYVDLEYHIGECIHQGIDKKKLLQMVDDCVLKCEEQMMNDDKNVELSFLYKIRSKIEKFNNKI